MSEQHANPPSSPPGAIASDEAVGLPANTVREGILEVPGEIALHHGGRLPGMRIAWRLVGPASAPVVVVLGAAVS